MKIDLDLNENISKNLHDEILVINRPEGSCYFSKESEDDVVWVWTGFVVPGVVQITIDDPLNGKFDDTFIVGLR